MAGERRSRAALLAALSRSRPGPVGVELTGICREIGERLGLRGVSLELTEPSELAAENPQFCWPPAETGRTSRWTQLPVLLGGERQGTLGVHAGPLARLGSARRELLQDVVDLLGPVLHAARLRQRLDRAVTAAQEHSERIAAARRQAFAERDQERRDLERDLHDGAQHHLVALRMAVALLEINLAGGDAEATGAGLAHLARGLEQAEQTLLSTAAGVLPAVLVERGLIDALIAEFGDGAVQIVAASTLTAGRRFPLAVETAVYFTCLEAVNNARKHAPGAQVSVSLSDAPQGLSFSVTDNGPGLDRPDPLGSWEAVSSEPASFGSAPFGSASFGLGSFGLDNMRARIVAAGGDLELRTADGAGTTVAGFIPI